MKRGQQCNQSESCSSIKTGDDVITNYTESTVKALNPADRIRLDDVEHAEENKSNKYHFRAKKVGRDKHESDQLASHFIDYDLSWIFLPHETLRP